MIVLGFDTATPATAVALLDSSAPASATQRRHDPAPGARPGHAEQLLGFAHELLERAGKRFADVDRIAVGLGPGGFTGLRIGVATARALAQASGAQLAGVSTLQALAAGADADPGRAVLAVVDARRGEVFVAGWRGAQQVLRARAIAPQALAGLLGETPSQGGWLAVGDGALRYRGELEDAGCDVPRDSCSQHGVDARMVCRIALQAPQPLERANVVPDYLRKPDAVRSKPSP